MWISICNLLLNINIGGHYINEKLYCRVYSCNSLGKKWRICICNDLHERVSNFLKRRTLHLMVIVLHFIIHSPGVTVKWWNELFRPPSVIECVKKFFPFLMKWNSVSVCVLLGFEWPKSVTIIRTWSKNVQPVLSARKHVTAHLLHWLKKPSKFALIG